MSAPGYTELGEPQIETLGVKGSINWDCLGQTRTYGHPATGGLQETGFGRAVLRAVRLGWAGER